MLFRPDKIKEINYQPGGHYCNPIGEIVKSDARIPLRHYKYLNIDYVVNRYKNLKMRLVVIEGGDPNWSIHFKQNREQTEGVHNWLLRIAHEVPFSKSRLKFYNKLNALNRKFNGRVFSVMKSLGLDKPVV